MTCFAAVDLGGQSGRVVLGRVHRHRVRYREVHRFANVPRVVTTGAGARWHWDTGALWEETLEGLAAAVRGAAALGDRLAAWTRRDLSPAQTVRCILDSLPGAFATATDHGRDGPILLEPAC